MRGLKLWNYTAMHNFSGFSCTVHVRMGFQNTGADSRADGPQFPPRAWYEG